MMHWVRVGHDSPNIALRITGTHGLVRNLQHAGGMDGKAEPERHHDAGAPFLCEGEAMVSLAMGTR